MLVALTRDVSSSIGRCELTHLERRPIDVGRAREQHRTYERRLRDLGCHVQRLPEEPQLSDSVFVEDVAVVFEEMAVITRPGALSRRAERPSIAQALEPYRTLMHIRAPGILDGGDVLTLGKDVYVGLSTRSNPEAVRQLQEAIGVHGYTVTEVGFQGCLHLKSAATRVAEDAVLVNPEWVDARIFRGMRTIPVDPDEPAAANALRIGETVLLAAEYPGTYKRLTAEGLEVLSIDAFELAKAEGGLTCCSLLLEAGEPPGSGGGAVRLRRAAWVGALAVLVSLTIPFLIHDRHSLGMCLMGGLCEE